MIIIAVKEDRLEKISPNLFSICHVTKEKPEDEYPNLDLLVPTSDLYTDLAEGKIKKKKFEKKYRKFLDDSLAAQYQLYGIANIFDSHHYNLCLTCSNEEYKMGYIKVLAEYISELYGIECYPDYKDAKEEISNFMDSLEKKEKKIFKLDGDEFTEKLLKKKYKIMKEHSEDFGSEFSEEGKEILKTQEKMFCVYSAAIQLMDGENAAITFDEDNELSEINADNCESSTKDMVKLLMKAKEVKFSKKIVETVLDGCDIKYKKEKLEKLNKETILTIIAKCCRAYSDKLFNIE